MIGTARGPFLSLATLARTSMSPPAPPAATQPPAATATVKPVSLSEESSHRCLIDNDYVDMANLVLEPNAATRLHQHRHGLVTVTVGASQISDEVAGKAPVVIKLRDGQVRFA